MVKFLIDILKAIIIEVCKIVMHKYIENKKNRHGNDDSDCE